MGYVCLQKQIVSVGDLGMKLLQQLVVTDVTIDYKEFKTLNDRNIIKFATEKLPNTRGREIDRLARNELAERSKDHIRTIVYIQLSIRVELSEKIEWIQSYLFTGRATLGYNGLFLVARENCWKT